MKKMEIENMRIIAKNVFLISLLNSLTLVPYERPGTTFTYFPFSRSFVTDQMNQSESSEVTRSRDCCRSTMILLFQINVLTTTWCYGWSDKGNEHEWRTKSFSIKFDR